MVYVFETLGDVITLMTVGIILMRSIVILKPVVLTNLSVKMVIVFNKLIIVITIRTVLTGQMNRDVV